MKKPKFHGNHAIIQPGEIYTVDGADYLVITGKTEIINLGHNVLSTTEIVFLLENIITKEQVRMTRTELTSKFI